jgi:Penicillin V acylase and related amidases
MVNVTPFEFIPYLLSQSESIEDVKELLLNLNLVNINYSENLPLSPLHWMIADENSSIIVEPLEDGLKVYDNPVGVLTNNPTFDMQLFNLNNYRNLSVKTQRMPSLKILNWILIAEVWVQLDFLVTCLLHQDS